MPRLTGRDIKDWGLVQGADGLYRKGKTPAPKKKGTTGKKQALPDKITAEEYREFMNHLPNQDWTGREKEYMERCFEELGIPYLKEHKFHPDRKWRFDYGVMITPSGGKAAFEYEGIMVGSKGKSRHTTVKGYTGDTEKYSASAALGWRVFRYTALNYKNIYEDLKREFCL